MSHTKGPWIKSGPVGPVKEIGDFAVETIKGFHVAQIPRGDKATFAEREANAALISAAPDLLAACKLALEELREDPSQPSEAEAIAALKAAIAKAAMIAARERAE